MDSSEIIVALISGAVSLIVAIGTWHMTARSDRRKSEERLKAMFDEHKDTTAKEIRMITDTLTSVNANIQQQIAILDLKMDELSKRVEKHNQVVERTYKLEQSTAVQDEQIKVANHRIEDLEEALKNLKEVGA